jgi:hypothetical protein
MPGFVTDSKGSYSMKIQEVSFFKVSARWKGTVSIREPPGNRTGYLSEFNQPDRPSQPGELHPIHAIYLEILPDDGPPGIFGPIDEEQAYVIHRYLRPFLLGRDPLASETLNDQMLRLNRHGRSGLFMTGLSPVDCALWDLKGKAWDQPVYRLLGGPTRDSVPAYASMLGFSIEPDEAAKTAQNIRQVSAQKWFFRYGLRDGAAGKEKPGAGNRLARNSGSPLHADV